MSEHTVHNFSSKLTSQFSTTKSVGTRARVLRRPAAFSLVELALALGVVSFAFIGIFGLIPTGLNAFHQAMDTSIGSQIAQRVINDVQQTDFNQLVQSGTQPFPYQWSLYNHDNSTLTLVKSYTRYFDNQGNEVVPANPNSLTIQEKQNIIYWVNTLVTPAPTIPTATNYTCLATVTIQVANNPGNRSPLTDAATKLWSSGALPISTYSAQIARNQ